MLKALIKGASDREFVKIYLAVDGLFAPPVDFYITAVGLKLPCFYIIVQIGIQDGFEPLFQIGVVDGKHQLNPPVQVSFHKIDSESTRELILMIILPGLSGEDSFISFRMSSVIFFLKSVGAVLNIYQLGGSEYPVSWLKRAEEEILMSETNKPKIVTFQTRLDEFLFLGEHPRAATSNGKAEYRPNILSIMYDLSSDDGLATFCLQHGHTPEKI